MEAFKFKFSLEILNHLGRGLYRNFATVVAEAVSNSWDAEATKVEIEVDTKSKTLIIKDNGIGMDEADFRGKFLNVGYARREDTTISKPRRTVLGRKGIGKLAMLSVSRKVTIHSKKHNSPEIGGVIDNGELDEEIKSDGEYQLGLIGKKRFFESHETGTYLEFESIKDSMNKPEILRKYLAILFNFSFSFANEEFKIYLNGYEVSEDDLATLYDNTEFLWRIGSEDNVRERLNKLDVRTRTFENPKFSHGDSNYAMKGYIASAKEARHMKVRGSGSDDKPKKGQSKDGEFKAGLHLFVMVG